MMKGGSEEAGKVTMSPLFPRLHVNDAVDRGGPRAPPRNKMALYEQFTIPSPRFSANKSAAGAATSSQQRVSKVALPSTPGSGQEGTVFSSCYLPSELPACMNGTALEKVKSSPRAGVYKTFKSLKSDGHVPSSLDSNSFPKQDSKSSGRKRGFDDDDFRVPTFLQRKSIPSSDKDPLLIRNSSFERIFESGAGDACNTTDQIPISSEKPPEGLVHIKLVTRKCDRDFSQRKIKEINEHEENFRRPDPLKKLEGTTVEQFIPRMSAGCENENVNIIELGSFPIGGTTICSESGGNCGDNSNIDSRKHLGISEDIEERESSGVQMSDSKSPVNFKLLEDDEKDDNGVESVNQKHSEESEDSEASLLDSASGFGISPDNVAGMVGAKHFWKARRVILNQQRVFALQVFELHRLLKVQKLIASSPQELVYGPFATKSTAATSRNASETPTKSQIEKNDSQRANGELVKETSNGPPSSPLTCTEDDGQKSRKMEKIAETSKEDPSWHLHKRIHDETGKEEPSSSLANEEDVSKEGFRNGTHSGQFSVNSAPSENSPTPWCLPPAANQWLMPVMSPSEGLVYKPCMAPYPPAMGFMLPMFGGCGPVDFNTYGFPAAHHQLSADPVSGARVVAPSFYPIPCGFPFVNSSVDAGKMSSQFPPKEQTSQHLGRSSSRCCIQASRGGGFHGSETMDPSTANRNFFPESSSCQRSQAPSSSSREQQSRVIKVVPHNPRTATESVARIFKSIQQERQLCDSA